MASPIPILNARGGGTTITIIRVLLALAPVAVPAAYLAFLKREVARHTIADTHASLSPKSNGDNDDDNVIPSAVLAAPDRFVVSRERVTSHAIPISSLRPDLVAAANAKGEVDFDGLLLEAYLSATMRAFAWTPQALVMARMGSSLDADDASAFTHSFQTPYLRTCGFEAGDRVCGVYVVRWRREGRVVLDLAPPRGWRGPLVKGALDVGFERDGEGEDSVRFVNETVM
ncbi:hypothetical protein GGR53DRAFT_15924 [Hypoxylon sp. FL1150]|nr:hypothetical protein GGR53DRAFT_15924 [Hypoxylon sp. FL1150]